MRVFKSKATQVAANAESLERVNRSSRMSRSRHSLDWSARLTIILIGTCVLFTSFFALDFLILKLSTLLAHTEGRQHSTSSNNQLVGPAQWKNHSRNISITDSKQLQLSSSSSRRASNNKLAFNLDLIYEQELKLTSDQTSFIVEGRRYPIQAELQLARLLEAYQLVMPFNPDIWHHSEPHRQMHLFTGQLEECARDLSALLAKITALQDRRPQSQVGAQHYKLMQLLDSFGRPEAGSLTAHPFWLGSYLECQQVSSGSLKLQLDEPSRELETRYCVGKVQLDSWPARLKESQLISIKVGLCLPSRCDSLALFAEHQTSLNRSLEEVDKIRLQVQQLMLFNFNRQLFGASQVRLADIYCLPLESHRRLSVGAIALLASLGCWLGFSLLCTWLRWRRMSETSNSWRLEQISDRLVNIMAIDVNLSLFFLSSRQSEKGEKLVNLAVLDCVKHLGCMGVILAHVLLTYLSLGTSYSHIVESVGKDMRTMLILSLNNIVDTFFVISGLLVAYLMFGQLSSGSSKSRTWNEQRTASGRRRRRKTSASQLWPFKWNQLIDYLRVVSQRYARMAPLYFLVYAWSKLVSTQLGSGPLWDYASNADSLRGLCARESWLWPLTFSSDLKPITHHCIPSAWSIAVDLKFFLLMPALVAVMRRSQRLGYSLLGALIVASCAHSLHQYSSLLDYVSAADLAKLRLPVFTVLIRYAAQAYSQPQNRMGPMMVGLLGGHLLHLYERRARKSTRKARTGSANIPAWPCWMRGRCFGATVGLSALLMLAPCLVQVRERARNSIAGGHLRVLLNLDGSLESQAWLVLAALALIKPLWSVCNCIILLRLATDLNAKLPVRIMCLSWWRKASKLNYALLLLHFELIAYEAMSRLSIGPISWPSLMGKFAFAYLCSMSVALPVYLLIEQPSQRLTSWLMRAAKNEPQIRHHHDDEHVTGSQ